MRLIPPTISETTQSGGERAVFEALAAAGRLQKGPAGAAATGRAASGVATGPDTSGWTVLHSFDIADHRRQLAGEIDFLCIVPGKGVLVVEVKGCHELGRHGGDWYYGRSAEPDHRGPFRQAADAMHSLRQRLATLHPELAGVPFWSAVCFPFVDFTESSPEWHTWQVIDRRALQAQPIARLIEGVLNQARKHLLEHHAGWFHPEKGEPTPHQCDALVDLLRPDFDFFESPKSRLLRLDEEVRHYTEEQFEALDTIDSNPRIVFDGPAGTGKTLLAIEAARRAVSRGRRVLLLCFNRPLGRWLQEETAGMGRGVTARTLHEHLRAARGHRAHARAALPHRVLAGRAAGAGHRGAARARGRPRPVRRDRPRRGPGRAPPQLPRRARPEPARRPRAAATGASSATSPGSASTTPPR